QPQIGWESNEPDELAQVIAKLEEIQASAGVAVSFADLGLQANAATVGATAHIAVAVRRCRFPRGRHQLRHTQTRFADRGL
ncbi:catalase-peroxidase, partial [Xylella fastidiosa subsp. multiplex]|nr:catalase-peroxidase [Xylella fastidiosa subsp. multiplex]